MDAQKGSSRTTLLCIHRRPERCLYAWRTIVTMQSDSMTSGGCSCDEVRKNSSGYAFSASTSARARESDGTIHSASPMTFPHTLTSAHWFARPKSKSSPRHLNVTRADYRARYYSSNDARFLTPDPSGLHAIKLANPQTWNLYVYTLNNPLRYTDPTGMYLCADDSKCNSANDKAFAARLHYLSQIEGQYKKGSNGYNTIANILKAYGTAGQRGTAGGSTVSVAFTGGKNTGGFTRRLSASTIGVKFASNFSEEAAHFNLPTVGLVGHEGQHVVDGAPTGIARFRSEVNAEAATQDIMEGAWMNPALRATFFISPHPFYALRGVTLWNPTWYKPGQLDNAPTAAFLVGARDYAADVKGDGD